ncbi:hypothetical protein FA15DRAFT_672387 [Coprinopsis marcescibilis]|uniref:Zn(2)-C6 fungal-type domain-containing protein n=1 Tax=Coprinopsis marcescibilis TaxID=230819 RepID=A0A5C3KMG5_COPMA|nr:hypothetical protein FA15DRAFT_672387 [Coprinopsis marcescibilis]
MPPSDKVKEPKVKKKPGRRQTSCAECRRLKLKCDKGVPCEKCVSRGCAQICPDGVLTSTKGNRMVLSGTEELHERIGDLGARIRELEGALRALQEQVSDEPHPLLCSDVLRPPLLRTDSQNGSSSASASASSSAKSPTTSNSSDRNSLASGLPVLKEEDHQVIDAFGTLTVDQDGVSKYIGKTARSEYLIGAPIKQETYQPISSFHEADYSAFPDFESRGGGNLKAHVYRRLPPFSLATQLCDVYVRHSKHLYSPVPRIELYDDILMMVYRDQSFDSFQVHHALALLFIIFALASHFNETKDRYAVNADEYYQLARTTLAFASPVRHTTVSSIQTLIHMAQYLDFSDSDAAGSASAWHYIGHAVRLSFSIGLHLNPARWKLPDTDINRRRRVFWQLYVADTLTSFYFGRPPSITPSYIDCPVPEDVDDVSTPDSTAPSATIPFQVWNYQFTTLMNSVMASGMGPKQPLYSTILDLDRQIREFPVPSEWRATTERQSTTAKRDTHFYRWSVLAAKETTLLNLHRPYFAQALCENVYDLQDHRYIPSIVAIYRSAWRTIIGLQLTWGSAPEMIARVNLPWSQALSAAIVMCLLIVRAPSSHLVKPALEKLGQLLSLFHSASVECRSAANLLPSIERLYNRASEACSPPRYLGSSDTYSEPSISQAELERLNGKTHLFSESSPHLPPIEDSKPSTGRLHSSSNTSSSTPNITFEPLHKVLAQDLRDYKMRAGAPSDPALSDSSGSPATTPTGITRRSDPRSNPPQPLLPPHTPSYSHPQSRPSSNARPITNASGHPHPYTNSPSAVAMNPSSSSAPPFNPVPHTTPYLPPTTQGLATRGHHSAAVSTPPGVLPPFPGTQPYEANPASAERKYATLTQTYMPGFDPTVDMLDPSWQALLEQLGY